MSLLSHPQVGSSSLLFITLLLLLLHHSHAFLVRIPSSSEYCFYETANKGEKIVGNFRVVEGGGRDIDLRITDPMGKMVFEVQQKELDTFQFYALATGAYTLCLSNKFSMVTSKTVSFNLYAGSSLHKKDAAKEEHFSPLEANVMKLSQNIREVNDWTNHMKSRERVHAATVDSTNSRVVYWRLFQISALLALPVIQIIYLRNLFETKRGA